MTARRGLSPVWPVRVGAWVVAALLCAACVSLPDSGEVTEWDPDKRRNVGVINLPADPAPGASPRDIVAGFLAASSSPAKDFDVSRKFLTDTASQGWTPMSSVTVVSESLTRGEITVEESGTQESGAPDEGLPEDAREDAGATVRKVVATTTVTVEGTLNERGVYAAAPVGQTRDLTFVLTQEDDQSLERDHSPGGSQSQESGQWRIASVPPGLIISRNVFESAFRSVTLAFPAAGGAELVPDSRWFPHHVALQTVTVRELLTGPAPHLKGAVRSAFPTSIKLEEIAEVEKKDDTLRIDLDMGNARVEDDVLVAMRAQLAATFQSASLENDIVLYVDGRLVKQPDTGDAQFVQPQSWPVLAVRGREVVELNGNGQPTTVVSPDQAPGATILAATPPVSRNEAGSVVMLMEPGRDVWLVLPTQGEARTLLSGKQLAPPSTDRHRWVWSVDQVPGGVAKTAHMSGRQLDVAAAWPQDVTPWLLRVAPDGARAAVVTRDAAGTWQVGVVGIVRSTSDGDEQPEGFVQDRSAEPGSTQQMVQVLSSAAPVSDVVWHSATELAVMTVTGTEGAPVPLGVPRAGDGTQGKTWVVQLDGKKTGQTNPVPAGRHVLLTGLGRPEWVDAARETTNEPGGVATPGESVTSGGSDASGEDTGDDPVGVWQWDEKDSQWKPLAGTAGVWGPRAPG